MKCYIVYNDCNEKLIWGVFNDEKPANQLRDKLNKMDLVGEFEVAEKEIFKSLEDYKNSLGKESKEYYQEL